MARPKGGQSGERVVEGISEHREDTNLDRGTFRLYLLAVRIWLGGKEDCGDCWVEYEEEKNAQTMRLVNAKVSVLARVRVVRIEKNTASSTSGSGVCGFSSNIRSMPWIRVV